MAAQGPTPAHQVAAPAVGGPGPQGGEGGDPLAAGTADGEQLLRALLGRPPAEIAEWALGQVEEMSRPGADVRSLPIFSLAGAFKDSRPEERQRLVRGALTGFGELPAARRAGAVRMAMETGQRASQAQATEGQDPRAVPLIQNLMAVATESQIQSMPQEELDSITQEAQNVAVRAMQPQQLADVVQELRPEEREMLTDTLVEAKVVPSEHRAVMEQTIKPGGYVDSLRVALTWLDWARTRAWVAVALTALELVCAVALGVLGEPCAPPNALWLQVDVAIALLASAGAGSAAWLLAEPLRKLHEDPVGTAQRWHGDGAPRDWTLRLQAAIPGVPLQTYRNGAIGLCVCTVMALLGVCWALFGLENAANTIIQGCSPATAWCWAFFWLLRVGLLVAVALLVAWVYREAQRHADGTPRDGDSEPQQPLLRTEENTRSADPPAAVKAQEAPAAVEPAAPAPASAPARPREAREAPAAEEPPAPAPTQPPGRPQASRGAAGAKPQSAAAAEPAAHEPDPEQVRQDVAALLQRLRRPERRAADGPGGSPAPPLTPPTQTVAAAAATSGGGASGDRGAARRRQLQRSGHAEVHASMRAEHDDALSRLDTLERGDAPK
ncbi:unnamed protein product [Prorocentrum cordatum]|uniref:Uncharacterized protein n=1 Tax=Prorocentrum cordatum TaxID=2364126 RepID=A0ABN9PWJ3_9DINO|nr:unnamed protein product [Polarella glacialis]